MRPLLLISLFFLLPLLTQASTLSLEAKTKSVAPGSVTAVTVSLDTEGDSVNALSGSIRIPKALSLKEAWYEGSLVPLWLERPEEREEGIVSFSAIFPGGFDSHASLTHEKGNIVTLFFTGDTVGTGTLSFTSDTALYANDGEGTLLPVKKGTLALAVEKSGAETALPKDETPPEAFTPTIVSGSSFSMKGKVLVFSAEDKGSGVARYEIAHALVPGLAFSWREAESPYALSFFDAFQFIYARAIDEEGNKTVGTRVAGSIFAYVPLLLILILLGFVIAYPLRRAIIKR